MKTEVLGIVGMNGEACMEKIDGALRAVPGVGEVNVSLFNKQATVQFDQQVTAPAVLRAAVQQAGYQVESTVAQSSCCGGCCS